MMAPRLFIEPAWLEEGGRHAGLPHEQARYSKTVLRLTTGARVTLFDGSGRQLTAVLGDLGGSGATAEVVATGPAAAGYAWVGLGPRVLRAETAALAALAVLACELDR